MADRRTLPRVRFAIEPWIANEIWHILIEECGLRRDDRGWEHYAFIAYLDGQAGGFGHEYRFMGALGFGGKFYNEGNRRWEVGCYLEDDTPARTEMIRRANERLAALLARVKGETPDG